MRKDTFIIFGICLIFLVGSVAAEDVAYVVKNNPNSFLTSELNELNLTYDVITEANVGSTDFSQYEMILVGDDNFNDPNNIPVSQYKSLIINSYHYYKKGILFPDHQFGWSSKKGFQSSPSNIKISDPNISITSDVSETFSAYTINDPNVQTDYLRSKKATGIRLLAQAHGSTHTSADSVLAIAYPGVEFLNGNIAQERSLFFGITDTKFWTQETKKLFENSIEWILIGEDLDNDGFFTDNDCNDDNSEINPDAVDIPYDGIDQNCDGSDLKDVDDDGFDSDLVGGLDCNDLDSEVNPDNPNPHFNCVNDAPVINNVIMKVNYQESEIVEITVIASDSEDDNLTYSINDSKFTSSENVFTWQTGFEDSGDYTFTLGVSDSEFTTTRSVSMIIINKNRAPLFNTIPDLEWDEDTNTTLNLNDYFFDEDNDSLTFSLATTSNDTHIILESIINGIVEFSVEENWNGEDWVIFRASDGKTDTDSNKVILKVLPVNDFPVLEAEIPDLEWDEDSNLTIDLSNYFKDVDSILTYSFSGNSEVDVSILESIATLIPNVNFNGNDSVIFTASDGEANIDSNELSLTVIPVNDAPVLEHIEDVIVFGGKIVQIIPISSDIEEDSLTFSFSSPLNYFGEWQTTENDIGNYQTTVTVSDGNGKEDSQEVNIFVFQKILINEIVSKPNVNESEWIEIYNPFDQAFDLNNCNINFTDNSIELSGTLNENEYFVIELEDKLNNEEDVISLSCYNELVDSVAYEELNNGESFGRKPNGIDTGNDSEDFSVFIAPTKELSNDADVTLPIVQLLNPVNNATFEDTRDINFEFSVSDDLDPRLECSLYINDNLKSTKEVLNNINSEFNANNLDDGFYSWNVKCSDGSNENFALESWEFTISAPDNPIINSIEDKFVDENQALEFIVSASDPDNSNLTLSVTGLPEGSNFIDNSDGTGSFFWTPTYEQSGNYDVKFEVEDETGLRDFEEIEIIVANVRKPAEFLDLQDQRCNLLNENLVVTIKSPDERDDFEPGETINIDLEIENNHNSELDVEVEVFLYDVNKEEVIESENDDLDVNEKDSEDLEFTIEIPDDLENERFAIFALAEGKNDVILCNEEYVEVEIKRDNDNLIIDNLSLIPQKVALGESVDLEIRVENIGKDDQKDVYVIVENTELGISEKSEEFDIEEFGKHDSEIVYLSVTIPEDAKTGDYDLKATIFFSGLKNSKTETLTVIGQVIKDSTSKTISLGNNVLGEKTSNSNMDEEFSTAFIIFFLTLLVTVVVLFNIYIW